MAKTINYNFYFMNKDFKVEPGKEGTKVSYGDICVFLKPGDLEMSFYLMIVTKDVLKEHTCFDNEWDALASIDIDEYIYQYDRESANGVAEAINGALGFEAVSERTDWNASRVDIYF